MIYKTNKDILNNKLNIHKIDISTLVEISHNNKTNKIYIIKY